MKKRIFLGGTCCESKWRNNFTKLLDEDSFSWFDPVVSDWNEEAQTNELREREECDFCLYVITPLMIGVYAIAEVIDDSNKRPEKTVFVMLRSDEAEYFGDSQWKSLSAVADLVERNGGAAFEGLKDASIFMKAIAALEDRNHE